MISITGGFNQQFSSGTLSIAKEKFARDSLNNYADVVNLFNSDSLSPIGDTLSFTDAVALYEFAENLNLEGDYFDLLDEIGLFDFSELGFEGDVLDSTDEVEVALEAP